MKKLTIFWIVFAFLAETVFAQSFTFSGDVTSGLWVHMSNKEKSVDDTSMVEPTINAMGSEGVPVRVNLKGAYINTPENAGFNFTLSGQAKNNNDLTRYGGSKPVIDPGKTITMGEVVFFDTAIAWLKFLDNKVKLTGGYWDPGQYETPGGLGSDLNSEGTGLMLEIFPIDGLAIAVTGYAHADDMMYLAKGKYIFSAVYELQNVFKITANYSMHDYGPKELSDTQDKDQRVNFGFNYLGLQFLGFTRIGIDTEFRNLGGYETSMGFKKYTITPFYLGQRIQFVRDALSLEARFRQRINIGDENPDYAPAFRFFLEGSYAIGSFVPKFGIQYFLNGALSDAPAGGDLRFNEGNKWDNSADFKKNLAGLEIRPAVEFRLNGILNVVEVGYVLKKDLSKDAKVSSRYSTTDHAVYATIKVSF